MEHIRTEQIDTTQIDEVSGIAETETFDVPILTVADGFRFGCGFILAWVGFLFLSVIAVTLMLLLALLFDLPLPFNPLG